jgi:hypothetical protein
LLCACSAPLLVPVTRGSKQKIPCHEMLPIRCELDLTRPASAPSHGFRSMTWLNPKNPRS